MCNTSKLLCGLVHASLCSSPHTVLDHFQDNLECYVIFIFYNIFLCRLNLWWLRWVSTRVILIMDSIYMSACGHSKMFSWWILPTMVLCPKCNADHRFLVHVDIVRCLVKLWNTSRDKSMHDFQSYRSKKYFDCICVKKACICVGWESRVNLAICIQLEIQMIYFVTA